MSGFAVPIARAFGPILIRSKPHVEMHNLLALLKVRTIHAVLVTLLVVLQYSFQFASSLSQQPGLLVEVFFGMFVWNVSFYIVGFAIIAVVQTRFAPVPLVCRVSAVAARDRRTIPGSHPKESDRHAETS